MISRLVFSFVLPPLVWLICGWPSLYLAGNQALLGVLLAHTYVVIWHSQLFKVLRGDDFTYGAVTLGLNIVSLLVTVLTTVGMFVVYGGDITYVDDVPKSVWGVIGLSLLFTIALPLLASRAAAPLPQAGDRRSHEDPSNGH